jgi:hypothetical protein
MTAAADAPEWTETLRAARAAGRPIPEFFIVGHPKSGTTALYEMLRSHPQIFMPELKETLFFARDELHANLGEHSRHPKSLEQYLALFAPAAPGQRAGEASPSYLRSQRAARRIAEVQPQARIIAILREPASFLRSVHLELLKDFVETEKDFRRAIEREERESDSKPLLWYSADRIEYAAQLRRYHETFGRDQVLVLIYDDYRADNEGTLERVLRFLDVDPAPLARSEANPAVLVRSPRAYEALRSLYMGRTPAARAARSAIKLLAPRRVRHRGLGVVRKRALFAEPPPADEELMRQLRRRYKREVVALSDYLGRDLVAQWGYDRLD